MCPALIVLCNVRNFEGDTSPFYWLTNLQPLKCRDTNFLFGFWQLLHLLNVANDTVYMDYERP